ncbi:MAG: HDOD domain-containing protein [Thermoguttaceae bacterium]|jgi:HD-like signal output (HDOD) protein|nr:HDOD domain-containing protein [Thermoguttaceae bacterium]
MTDLKPPAIDLKRILAGAQLPALPQSAIRLLELSQDPRNGPAEFALPIEADPGLTGQVLRFVNSSYFGFSREIASVKLAITLVGIRTIKNFSLWSAVFSLMPNPKCGPFDLKLLWQDSLRRALFARGTAKLLGAKDPEDAFAGALLQDMAVPLLAKEASQLYARLIQARDGGKVRLSDLEQRVLGWTHAEAAGMMARQWNLPDAFAVLVERHHEAGQFAADPKTDPAKLSVALSALLPAAADGEWHECGQLDTLYQQVAPQGTAQLLEVLRYVDEQFGEFAPVLKLSEPADSLVECFERTMAPAG